jgi:septation ring formation regulator EzrA
LAFKKDEEITKKIAHIELTIFLIKTKAKFLLDEIKEITLSEERNREHVTKLKTLYREVINNIKKAMMIIKKLKDQLNYSLKILINYLGLLKELWKIILILK